MKRSKHYTIVMGLRSASSRERSNDLKNDGRPCRLNQNLVVGSGAASADSLGIDKETNLCMTQMDGTVPETASFRLIINAHNENHEYIDTGSDKNQGTMK